MRHAMYVSMADAHAACMVREQRWCSVSVNVKVSSAMNEGTRDTHRNRQEDEDKG